ncbi:MAG: hypothetical protein A2V77_06975 [Anaeromyxobacter sp. RBG_16_69_14]|nr:MAG: hypothetical protein A2V77_06975 [Anaeromyxobacter sp. RBG_16_69_14]
MPQAKQSELEFRSGRETRGRDAAGAHSSVWVESTPAPSGDGDGRVIERLTGSPTRSRYRAR